MPARHSRKIYIANSFYHLYNRGVEKREIFSDDQDYAVFLSYLKDYLTPKDLPALNLRLADSSLTPSERERIYKLIRLNNFKDRITLLTYSLMPNHFHFLVKQNEEETIDSFLNSLLTRYAMYFNRKHQRVGHLFQDVYKAVLVEKEQQLLHLSRYIHRNPLSLGEKGREYQRRYTSLPEYLNQRKAEWIETETVLSYFSSQRPEISYLSFVEEQDDREWIEKILIEEFGS